VNEVAAVGVPHPVLGQVIVVATVSQDRATGEDTEKLLEACRMRLPNFMVPEHVEWFPSLPRNPNGKMDRKQIRNELKSRYQDSVL
jgi:acyl-CoA synthetase (AMP-forming)/AMP-acid ligase II